ncbi:hypothetical protein DFQ26_000817 [Actinomortierella ambigua]|nr:hypothetical protein DFQ26_000817 [Actinomortierella ambigua]
MSNLSTSTGFSRVPSGGSSSGGINSTARPGISARLAARLSTLEGEYVERVTDMLSLLDGTSYVIPSPIVEELELMVMPLDQLLDDAKDGDAEAQYKLGRKYLQALGVEPDFEEGVRLLEQAADQGHVEALLQRAMTVTFDEDVKADMMKVLETREAGGDGVASMSISSVYESFYDSEKAAYYNERATMRGQAEAARVLGTFYQDGRGVAVDLARARKLFSHAASRWSPVGQFKLGSMLLDGHGGPCDERKAAMLFQRSAAQGDLESMAILRSMEM